MARRIPKNRRFKPRNRGLVVIVGKPHDLGKYGSAGFTPTCWIAS
jgi:hypothetical protein